MTIGTNPNRQSNWRPEPLGPLEDGVDPVEAAAWTVAANVLLNLNKISDSKLSFLFTVKSLGRGLDMSQFGLGLYNRIICFVLAS